MPAEGVPEGEVTGAEPFWSGAFPAAGAAAAGGGPQNEGGQQGGGYRSGGGSWLRTHDR
ncbi:hypothetical protein [Streptomyces sp. CS62]|uniref:hypothetical protein n=1 Tax=Streptomyces sp. CS62 TaxID=3119268 RepID=UPI002F931E4D